jgi:putative tryptophan/tyrosine transport system substrate-binding protein
VVKQTRRTIRALKKIRQQKSAETGSEPKKRAKSVTTTIPIVTPFAADPIKSGYVASFNRPSGHITGVYMFAFSLGPKRLEILREMIPREKVIAVLANSAYPDPEAKTDLTAVEAAARTAGQQIVNSCSTSRPQRRWALCSRFRYSAAPTR